VRAPPFVPVVRMAALRRDGFASVRPADGARAAKMTTVAFGMEPVSLSVCGAGGRQG
jgi:hypothetical protein